MKSYEVMPFVASEARAEVVSKIVRGLAEHAALFNDTQQGCKEEQDCLRKPPPEMCPLCLSKMILVSRALLAPDARVFEVWSAEPELVGIVYFERVVPGEDALGHYVFFDRDLSDKTGVLRQVMEWAFEDHEDDGWKALKRITVEIPAHSYALAKHAYKKLGFGGPYFYSLRQGKPIFDPSQDKLKGSIRVEGVKPQKVLWKGKKWDLLVLGLRAE